MLSIFITCSRKQVTMRQRSSRFSIRFLSSCRSFLLPLLNIHFYQSILVSFYSTIFFSSYLFIVFSKNLIRFSFARLFAACDDRSPSRTHLSSISINLINPKSSVCAAGIAVSERSLRLHLEIHQPFRPNVTRPRRG